MAKKNSHISTYFKNRLIFVKKTKIKLALFKYRFKNKTTFKVHLRGHKKAGTRALSKIM